MNLGGLIENDLAKYGKSRITGFNLKNNDGKINIEIELSDIKKDSSNYVLMKYSDLIEASKWTYLSTLKQPSYGL